MIVPIIVTSGLIQNALTNKLLVVIVAITAGFQTLFRSERRADRYHAAWRMLNAARLKYQNDEKCEIDEVIEAYGRGERMIESAFAPEETKPYGHEALPSQSN